jgi:hypothetical protein
MKYLFRISLPAILLLCTAVLLFSLDLSHLPAVKTIANCVSDVPLVTGFYLSVISIITVIPLFVAYQIKPNKVFSEIKQLLSSTLVFLVSMLTLYIGVPVEGADGMAIYFTGLFCDSTVGALIVLSMIGVGVFTCVLYFLYSCKSFYHFKLKGV